MYGRRMSRAVTFLALLAAVAALAMPATSASAQSERSLKAQVKALKKSRDTWKQRAQDRQDEIDALTSELDGAYTDLTKDMAGAVRALAVRGRVTDLHAFVFEPIRTSWPCGATLYQGNYSWSLDVTLEDTDFVNDEIVRKDCRG